MMFPPEKITSIYNWVLRKIKATNFKSFKSIDINLDKFNVIIGANAAGKSNFLEIFDFLNDYAMHDLQDAISLHGGFEYFRNYKWGLKKKFSIDLEFELENYMDIKTTTRRGLVNKINYFLSVRFIEKEPRYKILEEKIVISVLPNKDSKIDDIGTIKLHRKGSELEFVINLDKNKFKLRKQDKKMIKDVGKLLALEFPHKTLIKNLPLTIIGYASGLGLSGLIDLDDILSYIDVFNFNPFFTKGSNPVTSKSGLSPDGSNLANIIDRISKNSESRDNLVKLINFVLPYVTDINTEKFIDKSITIKMKESYHDDYLPSILLSDGTVNVTAIIVALFFDDSFLTIIEEPERNLHPYLIRKLFELIKDASKQKQIIISTHNPEFLKQISLENILLIYRNEEGFSIITKPSENKQVKIFLENEMDLEDLFIDQILEKLQ